MYLQFLSQPLDGISHSIRSIFLFLSSGYHIKLSLGKSYSKAPAMQ